MEALLLVAEVVVGAVGAAAMWLREADRTRGSASGLSHRQGSRRQEPGRTRRPRREPGKALHVEPVGARPDRGRRTLARMVPAVLRPAPRRHPGVRMERMRRTTQVRIPGPGTAGPRLVMAGPMGRSVSVVPTAPSKQVTDRCSGATGLEREVHTAGQDLALGLLWRVREADGQVPRSQARQRSAWPSPGRPGRRARSST